MSDTHNKCLNSFEIWSFPAGECKVKLCITEVRNGFVYNKHNTTQISNVPLSVIMLQSQYQHLSK